MNSGCCNFCGSSELVLVLESNDYEIIECKRCKIAFTKPEPTVPDYVRMDFHAKEDSANHNTLTSYDDLPYDWKRLIDEQVGIIKSRLSKNSNILEIGCGEGLLLNELKKIGYVNLLGFEPSITAAARAAKKNLSIINKYFAPSLVDSRFDLVIMSHVFEHVANPLTFLGQVAGTLKPGGCIMLTQTNYKGLIPRLKKENWYAWVPEQHFWHFTPKGIAIVFDKVGFSVKDVIFSSLIHPHDFAYKISKLVKGWEDQFIVIAQKDTK